MRAVLTSLLFLCACGSELTIVDDRPLPEDDAVMFPGSSTEALCRKRLLGTSGPLGSRVILPPVLLGPPVTGTLAQSLIAYRDPDGVPDTIGVHILPTIADSGSNIRHKAMGTVRWGHEGATLSADFDLQRGVSFAVYGSAVDVSVANESEGVVIDANNLARIPVAGLLQPGCSPANISQLQRSFISNGIASNPVPAFATEVDIFAAAGTSIVFQQDGGVTVATYTIPAGNNMSLRRIPIPNDAVEVNLSAAGLVVFYLSI